MNLARLPIGNFFGPCDFSNGPEGNFYPVVEPEALFGAAIKGESSHYVITGYDGKPSQTPIFDEVVIANEFLIAPAFILTISPETTEALFEEYKMLEAGLTLEPNAEANQTPNESNNKRKMELDRFERKRLTKESQRQKDQDQAASGQELSPILIDLEDQSSEGPEDPLLVSRIF